MKFHWQTTTYGVFYLLAMGAFTRLLSQLSATKRRLAIAGCQVCFLCGVSKYMGVLGDLRRTFWCCTLVCPYFAVSFVFQSSSDAANNSNENPSKAQIMETQMVFKSWFARPPANASLFARGWGLCVCELCARSRYFGREYMWDLDDFGK